MSERQVHFVTLPDGSTGTWTTYKNADGTTTLDINSIRIDPPKAQHRDPIEIVKDMLDKEGCR